VVSARERLCSGIGNDGKPCNRRNNSVTPLIQKIDVPLARTRRSDCNCCDPMRSLLLPLLGLAVSAGQSPTYSVPASPQRLQNTAGTPPAAGIRFYSFNFQEPHPYHLSVHYGSIEGEPSAGGRYGVEAGIENDEAIAFATIDVIDEAGNSIQQVPMVAEGLGYTYQFVGLMTVPAYPFRVRLTGQGLDGTRFTRVHPRLFRPAATPQRLPTFAENLPPDVPREVIAGLQRMFDELAPKTVAEREALLAANPDGRIVIPRYQISNVTYAPLLSPAGGPIGFRVTYDIVFSRSGRYSPGLGIAGQDMGTGIVERVRLHTLESTIVPPPREVHAPEKEAANYPDLFTQRTDFLYEKDTPYRFTVERVPNYIRRERDQVTLCMSDPESQKSFDRMVANTGPTRYEVSIGDGAFTGIIENFYGEGIFYRSFMTEGIPDCDQRPRR
jgi:hypothetical protein